MFFDQLAQLDEPAHRLLYASELSVEVLGDLSLLPHRWKTLADLGQEELADRAGVSRVTPGSLEPGGP